MQIKLTNTVYLCNPLNFNWKPLDLIFHLKDALFWQLKVL